MTVAQLKLAAIRARLNGVWDHPALYYFGPLGETVDDLRRILDADIPADHVALVEAELAETAES